MRTADIRQTWLDFFAARGHTVVPSASLVSDDPTLMFTVAGMVPFVPYLTGVVPAPYPRATSVQKCIRTNDIEEVGKTPRHGTFFQMNGNFSFGDYFKEGAISYAWELLTRAEGSGGLGFEEKDLWVTVYKDDDEAIDIWRRVAGLPDDRIQRLDKDTNFWSTGQPGPAGPCSEIFFDRGPKYGIDGGPATDDDRYVEIWNLVFMQNLISNVRSKTDFDIVGDLPSKNIDTGMGLERVAFIKQGVENMYEIDQVRPVLDVASELSGRHYGADHADDVRMRVVADHVRSALMLIADGVSPSNEGRGYILRRLLRRSVRAMRLLGVDTQTFPELFSASRDAMSAAYPEVEADWTRISRIAFHEEETFLKTLSAGTTILDVAVGESQRSGTQKLPGDTAFLLHDTFGFPIELTLEMAAESGIDVDRDAFERLMNQQRERAKADAKSKKKALADLSVYSEFRALGESRFVGYEILQAEATVLGVLLDGEAVQRAGTGATVEVILDETALYAESGGQAADRGQIRSAGAVLEVLDVQRPVRGLISHTATVLSGEISTGDRVTTDVDADYRRGASAAHSATHLIHAALRQVLGPSATQAGSYNRAGYMRLDFAWSQPLSLATRSEIEDVANDAIRRNYPVLTRQMTLDDARALGAMALFGEKYGDVVRVVDIGGEWSRELCAGTHVAQSAEVGLINLVGESSVGSTARRVESLVGLDAFREFAAERALVAQLTTVLKSPRDELVGRIEELGAALKAAEKRISELSAAQVLARIPELVAHVVPVGKVRAIITDLGPLDDASQLRTLALALRDRLSGSAAVVGLFAHIAGKPAVTVATTAEARSVGADAGTLVKAAAAILGGGGGGKPDLAQAGGSRLEAIDEAIEAMRRDLGQ